MVLLALMTSSLTVALGNVAVMQMSVLFLLCSFVSVVGL